MKEEELKNKLTKEEYEILRNKGTESSFSGKYWNSKDKGMYNCKVCGSVLFSSDTKFDSTTAGLEGWPSFSKAANNKALKLKEDNSFGMKKIEVTCAKCGSHLGHLFTGVPDHPSGVHYCINSACLILEKK